MIAGIYVRTSTVSQGEEGTSLETQEEQALVKAIELGYEVDPAYIWREMESGAHMDRPVLNLMLQVVRNREVDVVIVYDHDRLSREPVDLLIIKRMCENAGVPLKFVKGPAVESEEGDIVTHILGYAAKKERLQLIERSMRGKERVARDGRMPSSGGVGLYGYDYDTALQQRTINETEAEVVRMMFQWAFEGISMYRIACMLNEKRIPSKTGKLWSMSAVARVLRNQAYTGVQYYGRFRRHKVEGRKREITRRPDSETILVEGFTPQLISPGFFEAVQRRLATRPGRRTRQGPRYLLSGFAKCGKCGSALVGSMMARGYRYYRCTSTNHTPERPVTCDVRYIRGDRLEGTVWKIVSRAIRHPEILSRQVQRYAQTGEGNLAGRLTKLRGDIADLKSQQRRLLGQRQKDVIDQEILESQIAPVKLLCDEKERELGALEDQQKRKDDALDAEERIAEHCRRLEEGIDNLDVEGKRAALATFGVKVEATRDDLSITLEIDPSATTIQQSPTRLW